MAESQSRDKLIVHISMISRSELFSYPPEGHLGTYATRTLLSGARPGALIEFHSEGGLAATGVISWVENAGSCSQSYMEKYESFYKIHWIPTDLELIKTQIAAIHGTNCPKCGQRSKIVDTRPEGGKLVRKRKCGHCKKRWRTVEVYAGPVRETAGRPRSK